MSLTKEELHDEVEEAQDLLLQAIEKLDHVATACPAVGGYYQAYIVDHLKIMASSDHNFLSRDANLDEWKRALRRGEDDVPDPEGVEESGDSCS